MWRDFPVLALVEELRMVFFGVSEEGVQLEALLEVLHDFHAPEVLEVVEVAVGVDAGVEEFVPVDALEFEVGIVLLELEPDGLLEVDVGSLYGVQVFIDHVELGHIEELRENFHLLIY